MSVCYYCARWEHRHVGWYQQLINFSMLKMFTDGTNNLLFWSWGGMEMTAHLTLPSLLTFYLSFPCTRKKGRRSDIFLNLPFFQKQIQFLFNTCNNNLSHMCFALCCNYFLWVVWVAMPLIFSVLDYLLLLCPATSITVQKTSADPLQRIFFSISVLLKLLNSFTSEAFLTECSS